VATTQSLQTREAVTVSGVLKYRIDLSLADKGDLPTDAIFVITIVNPSDSKDDTWARVATIADFTELLADRGSAVTADDLEYRRSTWTFWYDDLEVANNAQKVIKERIDELVSDYETYQTEYVATTETTDHPQVDESTYQAAVTAYQDAMRDTLNAEDAKDEAQDAYDDAVTAASAANTDLTDKQLVSTGCVEVNSLYGSAVSSFGTLKTACDTFREAAEAYRNFIVTDSGEHNGTPTTEDLNFLGDITQFITDVTTAEQQRSDADGPAGQGVVTTYCQARSDDVGTAQTAKSDADEAVQDRTTDLAAATRAYDLAVQAEEDALEAVQDLKPDFDPGSVEPSPA
jgi:hypothetical protein